MNKRSWVAKSGLLALLAGVLVMGTGCDLGMNTIVRTAVAGVAVQAVGDLLGGLTSGSQGG